MSSSLTETWLIPPELLKKGFTRCFVYQGPSMRTTFRNGHLLYVRPAENDLKVGDVIIFTEAGKPNPIVHRIISVNPEGLITRGDSNNMSDPTPIQMGQVVGKVEMVADHDNLKKVAHGKKGLRLAKARSGVDQAWMHIKRFFWLPYDSLRKSGWVAKIWRPEIIEVNLRTRHGSIVKYKVGKRTVAVWDTTQRKFHCDKLYDLVIPSPGKSDQQEN